MSGKRQSTGAQRRSSMADVAELAGVSAITVSRALRQPDKVAPETRRRIDRAIDRLRYVPDLVASSLASQQSRIVAVIVPTIAGSIFEDSVQGMSDRLAAEGYQLIIGDSGYSEAREATLITALLGRRPDALVLTGTRHAPEARRLLGDLEIPVVEIWDEAEQAVDNVVGFSNRDAGYAMAAHLVNAGYRRIAFLGGGTERRSEERRLGYARCLQDRGLGPPAVGVLTAGVGLEDAANGFLELIEAEPELDAVFCASDQVALAALFACQRRGWPVPEKLAIAGFGDFEVAAQAVPALTTIRVPRYEIGQRSAEIILGRLNGEIAEARRLDLGFEVVKREST